MKKLYTMMISFSLLFSLNSYAWWGDGGAGWANYGVIIKILAENIKRYQQLHQMIRTANNHEQLIRTIHDGINNSIGLVRSLPIKDERILAKLKTFEIALQKIENVYGAIPKSKEMAMQQLHDRTIAESFKMTSKSRDYVQKQEENALLIESQSRRASPKGAARITAQANAKILHSLNQLIKINTQLLKVQSEYFAVTNKKGKDGVGNYQRVNREFKQELSGFEGDFKFPRF